MDPKDVFKSSDLLTFWPTSTQTADQRVSATTRFILYAMCIVYIINRDARIFALGGIALAILYYMWTTHMIKDGSLRTTIGDARYSTVFRPDATLPTTENSMGNVLLSDYVDNPDRPAAAWYPSVRDKVQSVWSQIHPFERQRDAERNFYSMPATTIPNDQTGFAQAAYGKPFAAKCHDQGGASCDPDRFYSAFPERPQMRAGNGR
jgi:Family of unknown function (DUF5762)